MYVNDQHTYKGNLRDSIAMWLHQSQKVQFRYHFCCLAYKISRYSSLQQFRYSFIHNCLMQVQKLMTIPQESQHVGFCHFNIINPLNPELNPICYLLALLGAHHFLHFSRIRVKLLTFRLLMSYIYGAPILDVSRSHTTTQHSRQDSSGRVISSSQRPMPDNTRHSQQTNIHVPGGIRAHDLSRRAAAGRSLAEIVGSNPTRGMDVCLL